MPPPTLIFAERKPRSNHLPPRPPPPRAETMPIQALNVRRSLTAPPR
jgi:hypothetical protein